MLSSSCEILTCDLHRCCWDHCREFKDYIYIAKQNLDTCKNLVLDILCQKKKKIQWSEYVFDADTAASQDLKHFPQGNAGASKTNKLR